jgi:hypothetical protein
MKYLSIDYPKKEMVRYQIECKICKKLFLHIANNNDDLKTVCNSCVTSKDNVMSIYDENVMICSDEDYIRVKRDLEANKIALDKERVFFVSSRFTETQIETILAPLSYAIALAQDSIKAYESSNSTQ